MEDAVQSPEVSSVFIDSNGELQESEQSFDHLLTNYIYKKYSDLKDPVPANSPCKTSTDNEKRRILMLSPYQIVRIYRTGNIFRLEPGTLFLRKGMNNMILFKALNLKATITIPVSIKINNNNVEPEYYKTEQIESGQSKAIIISPPAGLHAGIRFPFSVLCTDGEFTDFAEGHSSPDIIVEDDDNGGTP